MALPVTIPNAFANATASIPLSQLDTNFNTLANAVNGISDGSETLANASVTVLTAGTVDINGGAIDGTEIGTSTPDSGSFTTLNTSGAVVFNDAGADVDFRVEGDTNANLLFVDASADAIGIGVNNPSSRLQVSAASSDLVTAFGNVSVFSNDSQAADKGGSVGFGGVYQNSDVAQWAGIRGAKENGTSGNFAGYLSFFTRPNGGSTTERMRITSDGDFRLGRTTSFLGERCLVQNNSNQTNLSFLQDYNGNVTNLSLFHTYARTAQSAKQISFLDFNGIERGSITNNAASTSYLTSSDYRLKENISPMTGALATVAQLNPVTYTWKADGSDGQGFIAHELQAVCPEAVTGEKDAVDADGKPNYQGVDTSFLVATLTAAIKELSAKNDALEARIAALEAK